MAHLLDDPAFEVSTRQVIPPHHIMPIREEEYQILQAPRGPPAPPVNAPENSLLQWILEDACNPLHAFQEYERYFFGVNSGSDSDVPEDELPEGMEDKDQLVPVNLQEEEDPAVQGDPDQPSPLVQ